LRPEHIAEVCGLPAIHKDPFDRAPIAQASVENLELVTAGGEIPRYASCRFRVVR
jgi:PIN domain nuclease of toxin-antitoxin system